MSYLKIAERIKKELDAELGFTFSVGLAPNKVVAKIASKWGLSSMRVKNYTCQLMPAL